MEQDLPLTPVEIRSSSEAFSPAKPLSKVILFNFLTFNLYSYYWFYRNWEDFKGTIWGRESSSGLKTFGLVVPIVGLGLAYRQFREIRDQLGRHNIVLSLSPFLLAFSWQLRYGLSRVLQNSAHWPQPLPRLATCVLVTGVLCAVQLGLNQYWQQVYPELPMQGFSLTEKVFFTLASFLWISGILVYLLN